MLFSILRVDMVEDVLCDFLIMNKKSPEPHICSNEF